jgi:hypothetical protein
MSVLALGVVAARVDSARQAIELLPRGHGQGLRLTTLTAKEVTVDADAPQVPVGIDARRSWCPLRSAAPSGPGRFAWSPEGTSRRPAPKAALEWPRLRQLASFRAEPEAVPGLRPARQGAKPRAPQ